MRSALLLTAVVVLAGQALAQPGPVDILLKHCSLRWARDAGLSVSCDGRPMLAGQPIPLVAYPPGWAWSWPRSPGDQAPVAVTLKAQGGRKVLTVDCPDRKLPWRMTVTAGPGDRWTVAYRYLQDAWDEAMNSETNLCRPTASWAVGSRFSIERKGGATAEGEIPLAFGGVANPFVDASRVVFSSLFGRLTIAATRPVTLYDYAARDFLWLGRDDPFPRRRQQAWSADFEYEPAPLEVAGLRIAGLRLADPAVGEKADLAFGLARLQGGPAEVTARLSAEGVEPPAVVETTLRPAAAAAAVKLTIPLPGPGHYACRLELLAGGKSIYRSPGLMVEVPRLVTIVPGRAPYMAGDAMEVLARVDKAAGAGLRLEVLGPAGRVVEGTVAAGEMTALAAGALPVGRSELRAVLSRAGQKLATAACDLVLAERRANAVVVDNRSHALLVDGLPFCPQGCYADIRTVAQVVETEAPLGFSVVAPYLSEDPATRGKGRDDLRRLLDRCAQVGVFVHLDVRAASHAPHSDEKWQWLREEIEAFRDHPALLSWYLADEPELGWAKPEDCLEGYRHIKELDPYHPVTMVFCQSQAAARYSAAMDVVMTDPYPIPNGPPTTVVDYCERIRGDLGDRLPLWIVPQAFGGGEWWRREPSRQEERLMTYLALIHGARGVQYFIRRPPLDNPTSPDLWSECRRLMLELGQLTPALASGEEAPKVRCDAPQVHVAAFVERGAVTVLAANVENRPLAVQFSVGTAWDGQAEVVFESRRVAVAKGRWSDTVDGFGTRVYRLQVAAPPKGLAAPGPRNLTANPSFEEAANVGTPDGAYLGMGGDAAASWFLDPRTAAHGRQSLRLRTPTEGQGISVMPYPVELKPGKRYRLSVWARGEREGLRFQLALDAVSGDAAVHQTTAEWKEYAMEFTASDGAGRTSPSLSLLSPGAAWFDLVQVVPLD